MSLQRLAQQHADDFVPGPYPPIKAVVIDFPKETLGQSKTDRLLGHRFCFHITDIIDINCGGGIIIADISDVVNTTNRQGAI
jgi:hypothetical protein